MQKSNFQRDRERGLCIFLEQHNARLVNNNSLVGRVPAFFPENTGLGCKNNYYNLLKIL